LPAGSRFTDGAQGALPARLAGRMKGRAEEWAEGRAEAFCEARNSLAALVVSGLIA